MQESNNELFSSYSGANVVISNLKKSMGNAIDQKSGVIGALNGFFGSSSGSIPLGMPSTSEYSYVNGTTIRSAAANHAGTRYASASMTGTRLDAASALPMAGQALNYGANLGQNIVGTFSGAGKAGRALEAEQIRLSADNQIADMRIRESAIAWGNGEFQVSPYLERTKGAFRMNDYHAGTGSGILPYFLGGFKFTFDVMKLKPEFIAKYDEYFTNYGYASSRVGIPHIQTYLQGTKTGDAPKFLQNADGYYVTYIKTMNCKINHYNTMVSSFLEGLFDGGIQLIDGDTLLQ